MPIRLKISVFIGLTLLVIAMVLGSYSSLTRFAHTMVFSVFTDHTNSLLDHYYTSIASSYPNIARKLNDAKNSKEPPSDELQQFQAKTKEYFTLFPWVKVNLLDANQQIYWTSNKNDPFYAEESSSSSGFTGAQEGNVSSEYIPNARFENKEGISVQGSLMHAFFPIKNEKKGVTSIAEVYYDVTPISSYLARFRMLVSLALVSISIIVAIILSYTSWKARRIINKQHEANLELTQAKTRAEMQNEEKSKFLANISHELRTPLNAIIGFSEIMKEQTLGPMGQTQYLEYVKDINMSGIHLLSLITDILDFSKAEANKLDVESIELDLNKAVKSAVRLVLPRAEEAKVTVEEKMPEDHIIIQADPKRLKQVILNLLSNSVKFTPQEGKITVSAWKNTLEKIITIEVKDTGIGIDAKDIAKAMASFGQVDNKLSRRYEGTGLGLPLTKKLVELMGGKFSIMSELGLGTTITLIFPIKETETHTTTEAHPF